MGGHGGLNILPQKSWNGESGDSCCQRGAAGALAWPPGACPPGALLRSHLP